MEMLLLVWEKQEMKVEKIKEKAQIDNLSKFSDKQIFGNCRISRFVIY